MQRLESSIKNLLIQNRDNKALASLCPYHRHRISTSVEKAKEEVAALFKVFVDGELDRFKKQIPEESKATIRQIVEGYVNEVLDLLERQMLDGGQHYSSEELINGLVRIFHVEDCPVFHK
ncbi:MULTISPECIES: hypothetical protein [Flammeovirga]|uniref:Uncharacterized protein n=1 Tax=Flammeovirga agarivorans TaxID=2726742 RepID=A0A7X8SGV2_9BACT|nr:MULTISPECIES: hypothetical protein [Flammeovirga]NLR89887.1 hypothetical protein [Flammeovirga agarivorans]